MSEFRVYKNISGLRKDWKAIYEVGIIKPTQSYEYYRYLFAAFYSRVKNVGRWRMRFCYYCDGQNKCIMPFVVNHKRKQIRSVSYYGRLDYDDIISTTNSVLFISDFIKRLCNTYPHYELLLKNINEQGILYSVLKDVVTKQEPCVAIKLSPTYEQYYLSLSKHQRQNIRTSYNRMANDSLTISLQCYDSSRQLSRSLWNQCEVMYENRHNMVADNRWKQTYNRFTNPYHHIMMKHPERMIFILEANGIPLAYMAGLYNEKQQSYYVPRLCINDLYGRYSPGVVLVNETVKYLIAHKACVLDLMLGDEPYKVAMGGMINNNYQLQITTDQLFKDVHTSCN